MRKALSGELTYKGTGLCCCSDTGRDGLQEAWQKESMAASPGMEFVHFQCYWPLWQICQTDHDMCHMVLSNKKEHFAQRVLLGVMLFPEALSSLSYHMLLLICAWNCSLI